MSPLGRGKSSYQTPAPLSSSFWDFIAGVSLGSASTAGAPPPRACVIYQEPQRLSRALRDLFEDSPIRPAHVSLRAENRSARLGDVKGSRPWSGLLYDANSRRDVHFAPRAFPRGPPGRDHAVCRWPYSKARVTVPMFSASNAFSQLEFATGGASHPRLIDRRAGHRACSPRLLAGGAGFQARITGRRVSA